MAVTETLKQLATNRGDGQRAPVDADVWLGESGVGTTPFYSDSTQLYEYIKGQDIVNIRGSEYAAIGDGTLHPLSERYGTLGEAQAFYPDATALTDSIDWAAIQKAETAGKAMYIPQGLYIINRAILVKASMLVMFGEKPGVSFETQIRGDTTLGATPMIHDDGGYITLDGVSVDNDGIPTAVQPGNTSTVLLCSYLTFRHLGTDHAGIVQMSRVGSTSGFEKCLFQPGTGRGVSISTGFSMKFDSCSFLGTYADDANDLVESLKRPALYCPGHSNVLNCDFTGNGVGLMVVGTTCVVTGCRLEVNDYGLVVGHEATNWETPDALTPLSRSFIGGISFEQNRIAMRVRTARTMTMTGIECQGSTSTVTSEIGLEVFASNETIKIDNASFLGEYTHAAVLYRSAPQGRLYNIRASNILGGTVIGAQSSIFNQIGATVPRYDFMGTHRDVEFSTKSTDVHNGLTGFRLDNPIVFSQNFARVQSIPQSATNFSVAFDTGIGSGAAAFNQVPTAVVDGGSTLPAATYEYGTSLLHPRGETGVDAVSVTLRSVTIASGEKATMTFFANSIATFRRVYRRIDGEEVWNGYFEVTPNDPFEDTGQAFDGIDEPTGAGNSVPTQEEDDADYEIMLSPSWLTTFRVTNKATSGFDMDFGTAAPGVSETVTWLMVRP